MILGRKMAEIIATDFKPGRFKHNEKRVVTFYNSLCFSLDCNQPESTQRNLGCCSKVEREKRQAQRAYDEADERKV